MLCSASLCQNPRCASTVCIVLYIALSRSALRRSARLCAVQAQPASCYAMLESLCQIPRRTGAVDSVLSYGMLCSASLLPDSALCKQSASCYTMVWVDLPDTAPNCQWRGQQCALVCHAMLCVALTDTVLYKRRRQCARLCYALRCAVGLPPELAQSEAVLRSDMFCVARLRAV